MRRRRSTPPAPLTLEQRLARLAAAARRDLRLYYISAQLGAACCAVGFCAGAYALGRTTVGVVRYIGVQPAGDWPYLCLVFAVIGWMGWFALHCLLVSFAVHRLFRKEYQYAARLLIAEGLGPVLAQEEYWRPLYGWRRGLMGSPKFPEMSSSLEKHIAFAACFMESLRDISSGTGSLRRYYLLQGYSRRQLHTDMHATQLILILPLLYGTVAALGTGAVLTGTPILLALAAGALLGALGAWLLLGALLGPLALLMRARILALCDFLLGRLDDSTEEFATPPDEEGWWLRRWFVNRMGRIAGRA